MSSQSRDAARFQQIVAAFIAAQHAGVRVEIAPFLEAAGLDERARLFEKLLSAEIASRLERGETPTAADYVEAYPQFTEVITQLLSDVNDPAATVSRCQVDSLQTVTREGPGGNAQEELTPGVPGYDIVRTLGKGGMGVVYEAIHKATGRQVALKMVLPEQPGDESKARLFLREATTLSQLDHKRIVKFHEVGISGGQLYLAMEYMDTIDLDQLLTHRSEPRCVRLLCGFICQVLSALSYAHSLGFVHRDVKPSNVLVARRGTKYFTKLADFGLAKSYEDAGYSSVTSVGTCRGTVAFMAPEQLEDPQSVRPAADVFATAATLYYFLSGRYPRDLSAFQNPVMAVVQGEVIPLDRWQSDLPSPLLAIVHRGLERSPEDRYPSADAMHSELIRFAKAEQE